MQAVVYMCIFLQDLHALCMLIICRVLVSVQCTRISVLWETGCQGVPRVGTSVLLKKRVPISRVTKSLNWRIITI